MNIIFSMFLSLFLFMIGIYFYRKTKSSIMTRLFFSVLVFASIVFYLFYGVSNYFTGKGINNAVIYHLKYGLGGAGFLEYWEIIVMSVVVIAVGLIFSYWMFSKGFKNKAKKKVYIYTAFLLIFLSLFSSPASSDLYNVSLQGYSIMDFDSSSTTDFYKYYKQPYMKQVGDSKNLVVIYVEGLERTYFNETIFPGLIKGFRELESNSTYFTDIRQVIGTEWTIGGIASSQCGIPLFTPYHGNSMSGMDEFLPSAVCLGDIMHKEGYHLTYYNGGYLDFAGKGKFYSTHKFDEVYGKDELLPNLKDKSYISWWGLYDDSLFDLTYQRFTELSETTDKFALFLLTLDTHHPNGHPSKSCRDIIYRDGSNPILNAVACSDYLTTKFVNKIMQSPYGPNTVVVIVSDHLAHRNTASELLDKGERRNMFMIIEPGTNKATKIEKMGSLLDIGPTILSFIGYKNAIGLGRDLMDKNQSASEIEYIHANLISWKPDISRFWNFPKIKKYIKIDITDRTMNIDGRKFRIPVLVELNAELETTLKFQFYLPERLGLIEHVKESNDNISFLLIDECKNAKKLDRTLGKTGFCLVAGKGNKYNITVLKDNIKLTTEDIKSLTGIPINQNG